MGMFPKLPLQNSTKIACSPSETAALAISFGNGLPTRSSSQQAPDTYCIKLSSRMRLPMLCARLTTYTVTDVDTKYRKELLALAQPRQRVEMNARSLQEALV